MLNALARQGREQQGRIHGSGYLIEHWEHRPGQAYSLYGAKEMSNGRRVALHLHMPGPFDKLAGIESTVEERYLVWVGWEEYDPESERLYDFPPQMKLPAGAIGWFDTAFEGPRQWFAAFDNAEAAEAYALSLPQACEEEPALERNALVDQVANVRPGPIERGAETFTFELRGALHKARQAGRLRDMCLGHGQERDRKIAAMAIADGLAEAA
ncbi:MAG: hypothetical protein KJZ92_14095 [Rhodocyclaceae bacterium]|nr:hypothetical protein [Rhodocyclaceae bacterium]